MNFFEIENLRSVLKAKWICRPTTEPSAVITGVGIDSREDLTGKVFVAIKGESHDGHDFLAAAIKAGAELLIVDDATVSVDDAANVGVLHVPCTRRALAKLALAYRRTLRGTKVIAVTGSAGKTTTKRLIHAVLSTQWPGTSSPKSFNNEIGLPLTILQAKLSDKYLVLEVGTNAPGEIAQLAAIAEPDVAVITMLGRSHLQGLGSVEAVAAEKASLLTHLKVDGVAILNADAPLLRKHLKLANHRVMFGESDDAELRLTARGGPKFSNDKNDRFFWMEVNNRIRFELLLPGRHNAMNALAAIAVARRMGFDDDVIAAGLKSVEPEAMRLTTQSIGTVTLMNDAYNANPDSVIAALDTFVELAPDATRRIVVLGDMLELGHESQALHREVALYVLTVDQRCRIDHAVFIGEQSSLAAREIAAKWGNERVTVINSLDPSAARYIAGIFKAGDAVLLKGSRGMGLERLVPSIEQQCGTDLPTIATIPSPHSNAAAVSNRI